MTDRAAIAEACRALRAIPPRELQQVVTVFHDNARRPGFVKLLRSHLLLYGVRGNVATALIQALTTHVQLQTSLAKVARK